MMEERGGRRRGEGDQAILVANQRIEVCGIALAMRLKNDV